MEDKILRGEYVDVALLLPDNLYQSQAPEIQLHLDDSSLGPMGSPVTMVRKRKPVIDSFQKWLEAYMVYMLVIVTAYPRRALELIKYQQIISHAVTKFRGLAWLSYDQQFRCRASFNLSHQWDKVDLELWTVTFSGLAKPPCGICSSPYHAEDVCPSADPYRKQRRSQTVCFDFNKPSTETAATRTCAATATPTATPSKTALNSVPHPGTREFPDLESEARSKVEEQRHHQKPLVSSRIDIYCLELELTDHPDRNFVFNLLSTLKEGARIGYSGPRSARISLNLISATQYPDVVSANLQKEVNLGRVAGPYTAPFLANFQCHPVGVIPEKHSSDWHTI